jgi:hypothetical protein
MRQLLFVLLGLLGAPTSLGAQVPTPALGPAAVAALRRLAPLVGEWTMATLPAGVTLREKCTWFVGERHVVCQMRSESATWQRGALTIFSYDPVDSSYAMTAFGSGGQQSVARGRAQGDTLIVDGELRTGDVPPRRTRVTIVPRADGFDLTDQEADGQGGWRPSARIRYIPAPR